MTEGGAAERSVAGDAPLETVGTKATAGELGREHIRGSSLLLLGRVLSIVFTLATQVLIVRALSVADFGAFAYALAIVTAARTLLSLGQGKMLSRFLSIYEEERDYPRMFGSLALATGTILTLSVVLLGGLALFGQGVIAATVGSSSAVDIVLIVLLLAPLEALDACFVSVFAVFAKPTAIFVRRYLLTPVLRLVVVVALIATGSGVVFLAIGYVLTLLVGIGVYVAIFVKILNERGELQHLRPRTLKLPWKAVFAFSLPALTTEAVLVSMSTGSVVILGAFWGVAEIARYRAVFPAARLNQFVFSSFVTLFVPMASRLFARGDREGMRDTYWNTAIILAVLSFPVFALTVGFAPAVTVTLFGERYADSGQVLAVLALGYYFNVALGFNTYTLTVFGRIRFLVAVNIGMAALNVGLCFLLVPRLGAVGVAVANCVTLIVQNVCNQIALAGTIGSAVIDRRYVVPYLVVAAAALSVWLFGTLLRPGILVAVVVSAAVSLVVLLATRNWLELAGTFPALTRVPVIRWFVR